MAFLDHTPFSNMSRHFLFATLHRLRTSYQPRCTGILKLRNAQRTCKRLLNVSFFYCLMPIFISNYLLRARISNLLSLGTNWSIGLIRYACVMVIYYSANRAPNATDDSLVFRRLSNALVSILPSLYVAMRIVPRQRSQLHSLWLSPSFIPEASVYQIIPPCIHLCYHT
ncbi:hypothetical protein GGI43DRAFT_42038 [Trichoderma evansii]